MAEADDLGVAEAAAVIDAGVAVGIDQQRVVLAGEDGEHAEIGLVAGGEHHALAAAVEGGDLGFEGAVQAVGAVGDARARRAAAEGAQGFGGGGHAVGVLAEAEIVVGAEQDGRGAVDDALGGGEHVVEDDAEGVPAGTEEEFARFDEGGEPAGDCHDRAGTLAVGWCV